MPFVASSSLTTAAAAKNNDQKLLFGHLSAWDQSAWAFAILAQCFRKNHDTEANVS